MEVIHKEKNDRGRLSLTEHEAEVGFMTYYYASPGIIHVDHTVVSKDYEGGGVGKRLFMEIVAFARDKGLMIVPECPYVGRMFERHKDMQDVRTEEEY